MQALKIWSAPGLLKLDVRLHCTIRVLVLNKVELVMGLGGNSFEAAVHRWLAHTASYASAFAIQSGKNEELIKYIQINMSVSPQIQHENDFRLYQQNYCT